ncbi:MAG: agmatinase [Nitratireductor sp.]|nr:agmatinase [Nitratireductor sp.]
MASKTTADHAITTTDLNAPAGDNTFSGVMSFMRRKYTKDVSGADVAVWGIPLDTSVTNRSGARFGPAAVRRASAIFDNDPQYPFNADLFRQMAVVDYGDCQLSYSRVWENPERIESEAASILERGCYLLSLGGDHFVTWPLLKAHADRHGPLALIQFDAHQDTWADDGEEISHGNFVTRAVREGIIDPERSIQIGIRTHAPEDFGIEILYGDEIDEMSSEEIAAAILRRVGTMPCYITFDIDCLDVAFAPGTGTPVAGGPSSAKMLAVLRKLGSLDIKGSDVVEVAPAYDHADMTAIAASTVAMYMLGLRAEKLADE